MAAFADHSKLCDLESCRQRMLRGDPFRFELFEFGSCRTGVQASWQAMHEYYDRDTERDLGRHDVPFMSRIVPIACAWVAIDRNWRFNQR
jgi:hypothetical protein